MYIDLKKHWSDQYRLSANKVFADFLYNLERGGAQAQEFIEGNPNLAETVLGGPEEVEATLKVIAGDKEAAENQAYFFGVANGMLARVRALLARKYEASVRYCEQMGIPAEDFTPETLLPGVRKAEEDGGFVAPETTPPATDPDPATEAPGAEATPEAEANAAETPAEVAEDVAPITEDDLKAKINVLVGEGASKSEIWQAVLDVAEPLGWGAKRVWAYIDEIVPKQ